MNGFHLTKSFNVNFRFFFSLVLLLSSQFCYAISIREQCRREIAGLYLRYFDQGSQKKEFIQHLSGKLKLFEERKKELSKKIAENKEKLKTNLYNVEIIEHNSGYQDQLKIIEITRIQFSEMIVQAEAVMQDSFSFTQKMKKQASNVFVLKKLVGDGSGYKFRFEYIQSCPKHYEVCPLKQKYADALKHILKDLYLPGETKTKRMAAVLPLACFRYSQMRI